MSANQLKIFELSKPIQAFGKEITFLEIREPTAKDVRECGFLIEANKQGKISINAEVVANYIESLAGIPMSAVEKLDPADFQSIGLLLTAFFRPKSPQTSLS